MTGPVLGAVETQTYSMPIDIRRGNCIYGPHTPEALKAFVERGEIALNDTVIHEDGTTLSVGEFLESPVPFKLRLAVPDAPAASPALRPAVPPPLPPPAPYRRPEAITEDAGETTEPAGFYPWLAVGCGLACFLVNLKLAYATSAGFTTGYIYGKALGGTLALPLVVLAINAARKKGRGARGLSIGLLIGFGIQLALTVQQMTK